MLLYPLALRCRQQILDLSSPKVMGILNITADSFYDGGRYEKLDAARQRIDQLVKLGVDIIDIGAMSSRPGAEEMSQDKEIELLKPPLDYLRVQYPDQLVSVDCYRPQVARYCLDQGVHMINDIRGGTYSDEMFAMAAEYKASYCLMHMRGNSQTMQSMTQYEDLIAELLDFFAERLEKAHSQGLEDILLDPGVGFAKTIDQNYQLIRQVTSFGALGCPLLYGVSRKSFLYKPAQLTPAEVQADTAAIHLYLLLQGVHLLRVHDVAITQRLISLANKLESPKA